MSSAVDLANRRKQLMELPLAHLTLYGPVFRERGHQYIRAHCSACGAKRRFVVNNLLRGRTTDCRCHRSVKYEKNPLAKVFGQRYDAIRQRHGKLSTLPDREAFIRYMLALADKTRPKVKTSKQLRDIRIQRIKASRGFEKGNLRLVQTTEQ